MSTARLANPDFAAQAVRDLQRLADEGVVIPFGETSYFLTDVARARLRAGLVPGGAALDAFKAAGGRDEETWIDQRKRGAQADV